MKLPWFVVLILILIAGVVFYVYYRPTLELTWFGRTVTLMRY